MQLVLNHIGVWPNLLPGITWQFITVEETCRVAYHIVTGLPRRAVAVGTSNLVEFLASELHILVVHTVTTHRRNISSKLQIHSPAGITIYAIVTKLLDLHEIQKMQ